MISKSNNVKATDVLKAGKISEVLFEKIEKLSDVVSVRFNSVL